jgi:hypothetical protein
MSLLRSSTTANSPAKARRASRVMRVDRAGRVMRAGRTALLAAALFASFAPAEASAQGDKAAAESLFQAGVTLMKAGNYAEACPKFEESQRADPSTGTLINLGGCYERVGKTASAWAIYKEAVQLARKLGQTEREATASGRVAALDPKLSKLRIDAGDVPGMVVRRDGLEVGRGSLGLPIAVDPGEHTVVASAPGHEDWTTKITVGDNADSKTVTIPPLKKKPDGPGGADPDVGGASSGSGRRTVGFIVGGVGVAALGLGAVFGALAIGDRSDGDKLCPEKKCTPEGQAFIDAASTKALVSTIGIGVGVAAVGAGVVLILTSGPSKTDAARGASPVTARLYPVAGPGGGGLTLAGSF